MGFCGVQLLKSIDFEMLEGNKMGFYYLSTQNREVLIGGIYISTLAEKLLIKTYTSTSTIDGLVDVYVLIKSFSSKV